MARANDKFMLLFGIPIDAEYRELARLWYGDLRTWVEHGHKDLTPEDRARNEFVHALADELRRQGVPRPIAAAWGRVGVPDPKKFPAKLQPGQPLGDLSQGAVLAQFEPLIRARLKHYGATNDEDAYSAAQVGLLSARADYDPAEDVSVGYFAKIYRYIDDAIKYEIKGQEGDALSKQQERYNVSGDSKFIDDEGESAGDRWGVLPTTHLPDAIADGIDRARDAQNRLHANRIPFWVQLWADQIRVRQSFGAREEHWTDLPCNPPEMAEALAKISPDKVPRRLTKLNEWEREVVTARFYRKPPIPLGDIARGALNPKSKVSYKEVLNITYGAVVKIAGNFEVKPPIRRPMRQPDPPRQLPFKPWRAPTLLQALAQWWLRNEIYWSPLLDRINQTVHGSRYFQAWTVICRDPDFPKLRHPARIGLGGKIVIIVPQLTVRRFEGAKNLFRFDRSHLVQKHIY